MFTAPSASSRVTKSQRSRSGITGPTAAAAGAVLDVEQEMLQVLAMVPVIPVFYEHCCWVPALVSPRRCPGGWEHAEFWRARWFERLFRTPRVEDLQVSPAQRCVLVAVQNCGRASPVCPLRRGPRTRQSDGKGDTVGVLPALCLGTSRYTVSAHGVCLHFLGLLHMEIAAKLEFISIFKASL